MDALQGASPRLYPASVVWCLKKPSRELREKVGVWLAWKRVEEEVAAGTLGADYERAERTEIATKVRAAEEAARDEVWASYRTVVILDRREADGLKVLDLGAGHASSGESLAGRVIAALKSDAYLNENVGASYLDRNWPPALKEAGEWPLSSLRQSFLDGSLTRLVDPDAVLRAKIPEFVRRGEFGLASGKRPDGTFDRVWFEEQVPPEEVTFEPGVFLLRAERARTLTVPPRPPERQQPEPTPAPKGPDGLEGSGRTPGGTKRGEPRTIRLRGMVPSELWNRIGTKVLPQLRAKGELTVTVELSATVPPDAAPSLLAELRQALNDLNLTGSMQIEEGSEDPSPPRVSGGTG